MRAWQTASGVFFLYLSIATAVVPGLPATRRRLALIGSAAGLLLAAGVTVAPPPVFVILNDWIVPPLVLLIGYWTSGLLFVAPMPRIESVLLGIDRALRIDSIAAALPRSVAELLEIAYVAVYPIIPIALVIYLMTTPAADPSRFWTVILITDFVCFGALPWIQTQPPRALIPGEPWRSRARALNLRLIGSASIQANTFPSGHAAEALSSALLVLAAPAPIVAGMFAIAMAISAGAVLGRYHYAADAVAGWIVAIAVWLVAKG